MLIAITRAGLCRCCWWRHKQYPICAWCNDNAMLSLSLWHHTDRHTHTHIHRENNTHRV